MIWQSTQGLKEMSVHFSHSGIMANFVIKNSMCPFTSWLYMSHFTNMVSPEFILISSTAVKYSSDNCAYSSFSTYHVQLINARVGHTPCWTDISDPSMGTYCDLFKWWEHIATEMPNKVLVIHFDKFNPINRCHWQVPPGTHWDQEMVIKDCDMQLLMYIVHITLMAYYWNSSNSKLKKFIPHINCSKITIRIAISVRCMWTLIINCAFRWDDSNSKYRLWQLKATSFKNRVIAGDAFDKITVTICVDSNSY